MSGCLVKGLPGAATMHVRRLRIVSAWINVSVTADVNDGLQGQLHLQGLLFWAFADDLHS